MHSFGAPNPEPIVRLPAVRPSRVAALAAPVAAVVLLAACAGPTTAPESPRSRLDADVLVDSVGTTGRTAGSMTFTDTSSRGPTQPWW
jgi:hypothetical protein